MVLLLMLTENIRTQGAHRHSSIINSVSKGAECILQLNERIS